MEGLRLTMRAVCLSVVAVGLAVPGSVGQTPLATPAAPAVTNNTTNGGINVPIPPQRQTETAYSITVRDGKQNVVTQQTVPVSPQQTYVNVTNSMLGHSSYSVTLQAQNPTSKSAESPATTIRTLPAPPNNIQGVGGLQKITVSWNGRQLMLAPTPAGLVDYTPPSYQLTLSNGMTFTTSGTATGPACGVLPQCYVITGLQNATSYNLIIASIDESGTRGVFSPPVVVRTANVALQ